MIRKLFLMLGLLSIFGMSVDVQCETWQEWRARNRKMDGNAIPENGLKQAPKKGTKPSEITSNNPGLMSRVFCATVALPVALARSVGSVFQTQEQQNVEPWFWNKWQRPAAVDVAAYSAVPWYAHAAHGYYRRLKNFNNEDIKQYVSMWQRVKALDFATFSKLHPIQSMKGSRRMMLPLVGPIIAAHATGLAYHAAIEHTHNSWYNKKVSTK